MGAKSSRDRALVAAAKNQREDVMKRRDEMMDLLRKQSPDALKQTVETTIECLKTCTAFNELSLLIALKEEPKLVEDELLESMKQVMSQPIKPEEWKWYQENLRQSSVWYLKTADESKYLYQRKLEIVRELKGPRDEKMKGIQDNLREGLHWKKILAIKNQTWCSRQDDERVGLLRESAILDLKEREEKHDEEDGDEDIEKLQDLLESTLSVPSLCLVAKRINPEFQKEIKEIMSKYDGAVRAGPLKTANRCFTKLESDKYKV